MKKELFKIYKSNYSNKYFFSKKFVPKEKGEYIGIANRPNFVNDIVQKLNDNILSIEEATRYIKNSGMRIFFSKLDYDLSSDESNFVGFISKKNFKMSKDKNELVAPVPTFLDSFNPIKEYSGTKLTLEKVTCKLIRKGKIFLLVPIKYNVLQN